MSCEVTLSGLQVMSFPSPDSCIPPHLRAGLLRCRLCEAQEERLRRDVYVTTLASGHPFLKKGNWELP